MDLGGGTIGMKNRRIEFPNLRVGGTSWVIEGSLADNLRYLSSDVSDMEIVLFDTQEQSNMPSHDEVRELYDICCERDMTCTVHFPVDICPSPDAGERVSCEDVCLRTIELFAPLEPFAWISHLVGEQRGKIPSDDMKKWCDASRKSAARIAAAVDDKRKVCVETLDYDLAQVLDIVDTLGLSVCLDIGHIIKFGYPVREQIKRYMPRTRVVHVHGVKPDGTDHVDLSYFDKDLFAEMIKHMSHGDEKVLTMEVFGRDYERSLAVLENMQR